MPTGRSVTEVHQERIRRITPWLVAVGFFMEIMDGTIRNTVVPVISEDLHATALSLKAAETAYSSIGNFPTLRPCARQEF